MQFLNIVNKHTFKKFFCMSEVCEKLNNPFRLLEILFRMGADRVNIKQEGGSDDLTLKGMTKVDISNKPVKFSICVNIYKALRQCWFIYQH